MGAGNIEDYIPTKVRPQAILARFLCTQTAFSSAYIWIDGDTQVLRHNIVVYNSDLVCLSRDLTANNSHISWHAGHMHVTERAAGAKVILRSVAVARLTKTKCQASFTKGASSPAIMAQSAVSMRTVRAWGKLPSSCGGYELLLLSTSWFGSFQNHNFWKKF